MCCWASQCEQEAAATAERLNSVVDTLVRFVQVTAAAEQVVHARYTHSRHILDAISQIELILGRSDKSITTERRVEAEVAYGPNSPVSPTAANDV